MTPKNGTTFKIIGLLCLALCGLSSWHYLELSPSTHSTHPHSTVTPPQAKYTRAHVTRLGYSHKLANIAQYIKDDPLKALFMGILAIIGIGWAIHSLSNHPSIVAQTGPIRHLAQKPVPPHRKANPDRQQKRGLVNYRAHLNAQLIPKIGAMLQGEAPSHQVNSLDIALLHKLTIGTQSIPPDVQKTWDKFKLMPKSITLNIPSMYHHYRLLRPLFFSSNGKDTPLLRLDHITNLFPNVTEITCTYSDYDGQSDQVLQSSGYLSSIGGSAFLSGLQARLEKIDQHNQLAKIIIQTHQNRIKANLDLYMAPFGRLGWYIGKERHALILIKYLGSYVTHELKPKVLSMIQGTYPSSKATFLDMSILHKLMAADQDLPADVQASWDKFCHKQHTIAIEIPYMYENYTAFIPLFFSLDPKDRHVLRLDKVLKTFPNVTKISCAGTDCIAYNGLSYQTYAPTVVGSNFILGLQHMLQKVEENSQHHLTTITISTLQHPIAAHCTGYASQFGRLGWQLAKKRNTLVLKHPHNALIAKNLSIDHLTNQLMPAIAAMIEGAPSFYHPTAVDVAIVHKLAAHAQDVPSDVQKTWDKFALSADNITLSMRWMYYDYRLCIPLFFSSDRQYKHLLRLDQITSLFPNVAEITCTYIDYAGEWHEETRSSYAAGLVSSTFLLGLQEGLEKIAAHHKLTKIAIQTAQSEITCNLAAKGFTALGWDIRKETTKGYAKAPKKHNQIILTKRLGGQKDLL